MPNKWKVISFYTPKYKDIVRSLRKSLNKFNIPYDIEPMEDKGSWKKNTYQKCQFIRRKLDEHNDTLIWLDADAIIMKYPKYFDFIEEDVAVYIKRNTRLWGEIISGCVFLRNTPQVKQFVDWWVDLCAKDTIYHLREQQHMSNALKEFYLLKHWVSVFFLPNSYSVIKGITEWEEPVIFQSQASRGIKGRGCGGMVPEYE